MFKVFTAGMKEVEGELNKLESLGFDRIEVEHMREAGGGILYGIVAQKFEETEDLPDGLDLTANERATAANGGPPLATEADMGDPDFNGPGETTEAIPGPGTDD